VSLAFGFVEWFRPGDHARVEEVLPGLAASGASRLRTHLSWADYHEPGGQEWYDWLLPKLAARFDVLPCIHYTPPSLSRTGKSSGAPVILKDYADFIDGVLTRHGKLFSHMELWNEPNNLLDWDWRADAEYALYSEMVGGAAYWVRRRGWKTVLGGPAPFDAAWLTLMGERGLLEETDAVGLHGFPGTWDSEAAGWHGWQPVLDEAREILSRFNPAAELWITETGYSTWRRDEMAQVRRFSEALGVGAERCYWYGWRDLPRDVAAQEGLWFDPRHYHLGAVDAANRPKLLARLLMEGGTERLAEVTSLAAPRRADRARPVLITGGSGFIGSNLADALLSDGREVIVLDNLSRSGVERNLHWLIARHGERVHVMPADVRDEIALGEAVADAESVVHLAAQTAVTTSLDLPLDDFEVNARGTLNLLEAIRATGRPVPLVCASTNKVYGALHDLAMLDDGSACRPMDNALSSFGADEDRPLDFCTPYGCSKGVADQYVLDYAQSFGLPTAVLRMSCIYGPRQFGTEDQGWVAHFLIRALEEQPLTIFGTGRQVRDILEVSDAVAAYRAVLDRIGVLSGRAFNLGGGPGNAVSLRQVIGEIEAITGRSVRIEEGETRQGDQAWYVADTRRLAEATGWRARIGWRQGLRELAEWLAETRGMSLPRERRSA
jgi:CDP-paratose 2-epimerase